MLKTKIEQKTGNQNDALQIKLELFDEKVCFKTSPVSLQMI